MPSVSKAQEKFMRIAAHDPKFASQNHIPQSVADEFYEADKAKKKSKIAKRYKK